MPVLDPTTTHEYEKQTRNKRLRSNCQIKFRSTTELGILFGEKADQKASSLLILFIRRDQPLRDDPYVNIENIEQCSMVLDGRNTHQTKKT